MKSASKRWRNLHGRYLRFDRAARRRTSALERTIVAHHKLNALLPVERSLVTTFPASMWLVISSLVRSVSSRGSRRHLPAVISARLHQQLEALCCAAGAYPFGQRQFIGFSMLNGTTGNDPRLLRSKPAYLPLFWHWRSPP